jgi:hypothetical protein
MFEGEMYLGVYDNRRTHGAYFNHNVQLCADFQGGVWNDGTDGFKETIWVVLW